MSWCMKYKEDYGQKSLLGEKFSVCFGKYISLKHIFMDGTTQEKGLNSYAFNLSTAGYIAVLQQIYFYSDYRNSGCLPFRRRVTSAQINFTSPTHRDNRHQSKKITSIYPKKGCIFLFVIFPFSFCYRCF